MPYQNPFSKKKKKKKPKGKKLTERKIVFIVYIRFRTNKTT